MTDTTSPVGRIRIIAGLAAVLAIGILVGVLVASPNRDATVEATEPPSSTSEAPTTSAPPTTTVAEATEPPPSTSTVPTSTVPTSTVPTTAAPTTTEAPVAPTDACTGSALALTGPIDGTDSLWLYDLDTTTLSDLLPAGPSGPRTPQWSTKCDAIFFVSPGADTTSSVIQRVELATLDVFTILEVDAAIGHFDVHDGDTGFDITTIVDDTTVVSHVSAGSQELQNFLELGPHLPWNGVLDLRVTSNGTRIVYQSDTLTSLEVVDPSGQASAVPLGDLTTSPFQRDCCALSPDGQKLAAEILLGNFGDTGAEVGMVLFDLSTGETETFTSDADSYFYGTLNSPTWSSDGAHVAFIHHNTRFDCCNDDGVYEFLDGSIDLWLATVGAPFATPIASFPMTQPYNGHEIAWMPNG